MDNTFQTLFDRILAVGDINCADPFQDIWTTEDGWVAGASCDGDIKWISKLNPITGELIWRAEKQYFAPIKCIGITKELFETLV